MGTSWIFLGAQKNIGMGTYHYLSHRIGPWFPVDFPLNQPNDYPYGSYLQTLSLDG
jgi:hypothetical protein